MIMNQCVYMSGPSSSELPGWVFPSLIVPSVKGGEVVLVTVNHYYS